MKGIIRNVVAMLLLSLPLQAQESIEVKHSCGFDKDEVSKVFSIADASSEAEKITNEILSTLGLKANFIVKSGDCKNALATTINQQRYILVNPLFIEDYKKDTGSKWAAYCLLAHLIGHHLNGHDLDTADLRMRKKMELEADVFAGGVLFALGASLNQTKNAMKAWPPSKNSNLFHPPVARIEATANGWKAMHRDNKRADSSSKVSTKIKKEENPTSPADTGGINENSNSSEGYSDINFERAKFPFPPPLCYTLHEMPKSDFSTCSVLGDVSQQITSSLAEHQYPYRFMSIPKGFAIVTQMEQYEKDGKIKNGKHRWLDYPDKLPFSFSMDYFKSLVYPNKCYLRVFVFLVTTESFGTDERRVDKDEAASWLAEGINKLPTEIMKKAFSDNYSVSVLVYEFEVPESNYSVRQNCPCHHPALTHMEQTGLVPAISNHKIERASDILITRNLVGIWQLAYYNENRQLITSQNVFQEDGLMTVQNFVDGILSQTNYYRWEVKNNIVTMADQDGYYYNYSATFYGINTVVMTFLATNGNTTGVSYGTQFTYNRAQ